jgi:hypothetical protein
MGTRADFYVRKGADLEWIGSVAWDGYDIAEMTEEAALKSERNRSCAAVKLAKTEPEFRNAVTLYFSHREDVVLPEDGWPWPWEDSLTTDMAYVFDGDRTRVFPWGGKYAAEEGDDSGGDIPDFEWPNMKEIMNVKDAGFIIIGAV